MKAKTKTRRPIDPATMDALARRLADYRLKGCRDEDSRAIVSDTRKVAKDHGVSYSEVWPEVHRLAYAIIDASGQADF